MTSLVLFSQVGFAYARHDVLRDLSLQLDPGEVIVLQGCSGVGKSTLLRLAAFCVPQVDMSTSERNALVLSFRNPVCCRGEPHSRTSCYLYSAWGWIPPKPDKRRRICWNIWG